MYLQLLKEWEKHYSKMKIHKNTEPTIAGLKKADAPSSSQLIHTRFTYPLKEQNVKEKLKKVKKRLQQVKDLT